MNFQKFKHIAIVSIVVVCLVGCGLVTKKYQPIELTKEQQENLYRDYSEKDTLSIVEFTWQEFFNDEYLKAIIAEALVNNYDLKNAILQTAFVENNYKQSKLNLLPNFDFTPQVAFNRTSRNSLNLPSNININLNTTTVSIGFATSWELDIWGKLSSAKRSSQANWYKSIASQNAIKTFLIASIANQYYSLIALDKQLTITEETIKIREKTVQTLKALMESGVVTGADVVQAEANLYAAQVSIPELKKQIRETENAISILMGKPLHAIKRGKFDDETLNADLKIGLPVQLLSNRPDVQMAELNFRNAFELTNVARASLYPNLRLTTGTGGISALTTRTLLDPASIFGNLILGLTQPIFQKGQLKNNLKNAEIVKLQAWNEFEKTLLIAGQEVTDAIYAYEITKEKQMIRAKQIQTLEKAVDFRMKLLEYSSTTNYTDVLTSEQSLLTAQLSEVNDKLMECKAIIELYRALGGGWK